MLVAEKPSTNQSIAPPLVPLFVIPTDNPYINPVFMTIAPERFYNEKFDTFNGDPFIPVSTCNPRGVLYREG